MNHINSRECDNYLILASLNIILRSQLGYGSETHLREVPIYVKSRIVTLLNVR